MIAKYGWQVTEKQSSVLHDLPDDEFDKRLEQLALQVELWEGKEEECTSAPSANENSASLPQKMLT